MTEHAGLRAVISKAQIIDELEDGLPSWAKRLGGDDWYPPYIHVLKVRIKPSGLPSYDGEPSCFVAARYAKPD